MNKPSKYVKHLVKLEFMKAQYEVFVNDSGSSHSQSFGECDRGVDFIVKTKSGKYHEFHYKC